MGRGPASTTQDLTSAKIVVNAVVSQLTDGVATEIPDLTTSLERPRDIPSLPPSPLEEETATFVLTSDDRTEGGAPGRDRGS